MNPQVAAQQGRGPFSETPSDTRRPVLKSTMRISHPGLRRFGRGSRRKSPVSEHFPGSAVPQGHGDPLKLSQSSWAVWAGNGSRSRQGERRGHIFDPVQLRSCSHRRRGTGCGRRSPRRFRVRPLHASKRHPPWGIKPLAMMARGFAGALQSRRPLATEEQSTPQTRIAR